MAWDVYWPEELSYLFSVHPYNDLTKQVALGHHGGDPGINNTRALQLLNYAPIE